MSPASAVVDEMRTIVCDAVESHRAHGMKAALARAAGALGISVRRARAYLHREVRCVRAEEADQLRARRAEVLAARLRRLDHEADLLRARLREGEVA